MSFTVVFAGDIREWPRNPFDEITVFGCPYAIAVGNLLEQRDELLEAVQQILLCADDGPRGIAGIDSGGNLCIRGSFLAMLERARDAASKAEWKS